MSAAPTCEKTDVVVVGSTGQVAIQQGHKGVDQPTENQKVKSGVNHAQNKGEKMHISQFADKLRCQYCGKTNKTREWPLQGDYVPFYYQKEPGNYTLKIACPHCGKDWYVVWDQNPGPTKPLTF